VAYGAALLVIALGIWACTHQSEKAPSDSNFHELLSSNEFVQIGRNVSGQAILEVDFTVLDTVFRRYHRENYGVDAYLVSAFITTHIADSLESVPYLIFIGKKSSANLSLNFASEAVSDGSGYYKIYDLMATHTCTGDPCQSCSFTRKDGKWWKRITGCVCNTGGLCNHSTTQEPPIKSIFSYLKYLI
jgi:hypothetical protein